MDAQTAQSPNSRIAALVPESGVSTPNERPNRQPGYFMLSFIGLLLAAGMALFASPAHAQSNGPFDDTFTITTPEVAPKFVRNGAFFGHWPDGFKSHFEKRSEGVTPFNVVEVYAGNSHFVQQRPGIWTTKNETFREVGRDRTGVYLESVEDDLWVIFDFDRKLVFQGPRNSSLLVAGSLSSTYRASWAFRIINYDDKYAPRPLPTQKHPEQNNREFRQYVQAAREDYRAADKEFGITDGPTPGGQANAKSSQPSIETAGPFVRNGPVYGHWPAGYTGSAAKTDRAVSSYNVHYVEIAGVPFLQQSPGTWSVDLRGTRHTYNEVGRDATSVYLESPTLNRRLVINLAKRKIFAGPSDRPLNLFGDIDAAFRPDWSFASYDASHPNARDVEQFVPPRLHTTQSGSDNTRFRGAVKEDYRIGAAYRQSEDRRLAIAAESNRPPSIPVPKFVRNGFEPSLFPPDFERLSASTTRGVTSFNVTRFLKEGYSPYFEVLSPGQWQSSERGEITIYDEVGRDADAVYLENRDINSWVKLDMTNKQILGGRIGEPFEWVVRDVDFIYRKDWGRRIGASFDDGTRPLPTRKHLGQSAAEFERYVEEVRSDYSRAESSYANNRAREKRLEEAAERRKEEERKKREVGLANANMPAPAPEPVAPVRTRSTYMDHVPGGYDFLNDAKTRDGVNGLNVIWGTTYFDTTYGSIYQVAPGRWIEDYSEAADGLKYELIEIGRNQESVFLEDRERNLAIELNVERGMVRQGPITGPLKDKHVNRNWRRAGEETGN